MTRKHFQWAADYIAVACSESEAMVLALFCCAMFSHFNSRFDRSRFMRAAGVDDD